MALANYTDLLASVAAWLDRSDLTSVIPDFVALFEANANTEGAIRTQFNRTSTTLTTTANINYVTPPTDFLSADSLLVTVPSGPYEVLSPFGGAAGLYTSYPNAAVATGRPKGYINLASKLELAPVPDAAYTVTLYYYQKVPALVTNTTNWLMTNFPQIYLFGTLTAAEAYLGSDPRIQIWGTAYDNAIQKLQGSIDRNKYGGSPLSVKVDAVA